MGERTSYPPGTFSWAELVASDAGAAKAFCYVTVASADETARKAKDSGGSVTAEPFDVMDSAAWP